MRIVITGGGGFQGSFLAEKWVKAGHAVTVLNTHSLEANWNLTSVAEDISIVWGSVTDREIVEKTLRGHDVVVHMAARVNVDQSIANPESFVDVNIGGTLNILETVRQTGARMIFASSCEVYGDSDGTSLTEHSELRPHSPYAASKAGADRMCFAYYQSYGTNITILRPSNVYGERQRTGVGGAVIPIFVSLASKGNPLTVFGNGEQRREYIHVSDIANAYDLVLNRSDLSGVTLNVGTGDTPSIKEIAKYIGDKTGVSIVNQPPRPGEVSGFSLDSSAIRKLGFSPQVNLWDGLDRYLAAAKFQDSLPGDE